MIDTPKGACFAIIHGGAIQEDGSTEAMFTWPKDQRLTLGTQICVVSKDALLSLVDKATDLVKRADSTIITDAARQNFRKVYAEDIALLAAALKRLSSGEQESES